jgi:succinyl-CoA synthetase beta subunit
MNLHEYQAKMLLEQVGIPIPKFGIASTRGEAVKIIEELQLQEAVVKIQVHAGGRGKAGGVKFAKGREETLQTVDRLLGMKMVNNQTGPQGIVANKVMLSKPLDIAKEYYLGAVIDRERGGAYLIASREGGMEIEELAEKHPEKILKIEIALNGKMKSYQLLRFCQFMGFTEKQKKEAMSLCQGLAKVFIEKDATLLEINPLVEDKQGNIFALDAKISIDENALFRQIEICNFYDPTQISEQEAEAKEFDLAYIAMEGNIGCMVNGAGLAMATMDIIKLFGGVPANFLDVGGGASREKVAAGFRIILEDPKVQAILVNIFGGIMNCATLADGIIHAAKELHIHVPIVVRMEGTNVEEGKKLLEESDISILSADTLDQAAKMVVEATKKGNDKRGK